MKTPKEKAEDRKIADLAKKIAQVYNLDNAPEVFDGDYETQAKSPQFIAVLLFNCMMMSSLYGCRRGGCAGCRAREVFDNVEDSLLKTKIASTLRMIDLADLKHPPLMCGQQGRGSDKPAFMRTAAQGSGTSNRHRFACAIVLP